MKFLFPLALALLATVFPGMVNGQTEKNDRKAPAIHSVSDLGHEFSFYNDGRFATQYLQGQKDVRSWGNLYGLDISNANLINLLSCNSKLKYTDKDITFLRKFLQGGGGVLIASAPGENGQNNLCKVFGAEFIDTAEPPLSFNEKMGDTHNVENGNGSYMKLDVPSQWTIALEDNQKRPVVAYRSIGKGKVLVMPRSFIGSRPDAKDKINTSWITPLLETITEGKKINPAKPFHGNSLTSMGNSKKVGSINYHYSDYLAPYFEGMVKIDRKCRPLIEKRMGVPLSDGMAASVGLLATGGGGFSSGSNIGLAVFWEDFPEKEYGMIEFLTHESTHSWVLPHPEVWNEPIATYVGDLVMGDAGYKEEGDRRIENIIERARKIDPSMKKYGIHGEPAASDATELPPGQRNDIHWGKSFWILEEFRKMDPEFLAKYFRAKRKYAPKNLPGGYNMHDTAMVTSIALGKDMFPWFNEHGIKVDKSESRVPQKNFTSTK